MTLEPKKSEEGEAVVCFMSGETEKDGWMWTALWLYLLMEGFALLKME